MTKMIKFVSGALLTLSSVSVLASGLAAPTGPVILTISGNISLTNAGDVAEFDRAMIEAIAPTRVQTMTPWTEGVPVFEGPMLRGLIEYVGGTGVQIKATALNDYSAVIPMSDIQQYDIVLAMKQDDKTLRVRDKGPFFVVYPFSQNPSLNTEVIHNRSVWQVKSITVE
jgi:hypothetical protein